MERGLREPPVSGDVPGKVSPAGGCWGLLSGRKKMIQL